MRRFLRVLPAAAAAAALAALPSLVFGGPLDDEIAEKRADIAAAEEREGVVTSEIEATTERIRGVEARIGRLQERIEALERELAERRERLAALAELQRSQTRRLEILRRTHAEAQRRLENRLVELYRSEPPDLVAIILGSSSLAEVIDQLEYASDIASQDHELVERLREARTELRAARERTAVTRGKVADALKALAARTRERWDALEELLAHREDLVEARAAKQQLVDEVRAQRHAAEEDLDALVAESKRLAAEIQAAQAQAASAGTPAAGTPTASGFVWPVQGVITSGFGLRWGRMHEGVDIAAPTGTTIVAAAAGTVVIAGWSGGYGNLVVVDHGGGLATAYAHQSAISVGVGQWVEQGQAVGAVGSTGHSTGPHLHLEVRIGGAPVDPLGYL